MTTKGPKEVTTKDLRRVEQGKKLQENNRKRGDELKALKAERKYFGIGAS